MKSGTRIRVPLFYVFARADRSSARAQSRPAHSQEEDPHQHGTDADHRERGEDRCRLRRDQPVGRGLARRDRGKRRRGLAVRGARDGSAAGCIRRDELRSRSAWSASSARDRCELARMCRITRCDVGGIGHRSERGWRDGARRRRSDRSRVMKGDHRCYQPREETTANGARDAAAFTARSRTLALVLPVQLRCRHHQNGDCGCNAKRGSERQRHQHLRVCIGTLQFGRRPRSYEHGGVIIPVKLRTPEGQ